MHSDWALNHIPLNLALPAGRKNGTVKSLLKSGRTYGTTEVSEKYSVSSRKKIKRERHREVENRLVGSRSTRRLSTGG
jgi:hypothetical protein